MNDATPQLTVGAVAALLGLSPDRVRQLANAGVLPHAVTSTGVRLFSADVVRRVAAEREATRAAHTTRRAP